MAKDSGTVNIHGKQYKTVALRVSEFREKCGIDDDWAIVTELLSADADVVIMKAAITHNGVVIGTGHAEERRSATQINKTSALENCETSAIGRALAACGFAGTEYASANEVQNAIGQQEKGEASYTAKGTYQGKSTGRRPQSVRQTALETGAIESADQVKDYVSSIQAALNSEAPDALKELWDECCDHTDHNLHKNVWAMLKREEQGQFNALLEQAK